MDNDGVSFGGNVWDHPDFPDVLDFIAKFGGSTKEELIRMLYDPSGEGLTKGELEKRPKGNLLAMLVDGHFGGTCQ